MKTKKEIADLVRAAQIAGADEKSQAFWSEVEGHLADAKHRRETLVQPRNLTEPPKAHTV